MRRLIVNADDFGYTRGVNRAIVDAHRGGIVTSTSLMATGLASEMTNGAAFEDAVELAMSSPGLDIGCHLNLVEGVPVSSAARVPHLVDSDGKFLGLRRLGARLIFGAVPLAELETECRSQVERILESGLRPAIWILTSIRTCIRGSCWRWRGPRDATGFHGFAGPWKIVRRPAEVDPGSGV